MKTTTMEFPWHHSRNWRVRLLILIILFGAGVLAVHGPVSQDISYHNFADGRALAGIDNFFNVFSNLPFLLIGAMGIRTFWGDAKKDRCSLAIICFFGGLFLTGLGSAFYHLNPDNQSLVWDRLPMTLVFTSLTAIMIDAYLQKGLGGQLLPHLLASGIGSVVWWIITLNFGQEDLRPYILVQFLPLLLFPFLLLLFESEQFRRWEMMIFFILYLAAKLCEMLDREIFSLLHILSGHSFKHLLAAAAALWFMIIARHGAVDDIGSGQKSREGKECTVTVISPLRCERLR